jgi:hypothetical protein
MKLFGRKKKEINSDDTKKELTPQMVLLNDSKRIASNFVLTVVSALITLPLFVIVYRYVPDIIIPLGDGLRIDHILTFIVIFIVIRLFVALIRFFLYGLLIIMIFVMFVGQINGRYGFTQMYSSYVDLITFVGTNTVKIPFLPNTKTTIKDADKIIAAIDYHNPKVRDFAVKSSLNYFTKEKYNEKFRNVVKYFSVFKTLSKWQYVNDPLGEDYYAKASESVSLMSGDCDDYSILMAACIKAIGGEVRLVRTLDHLYPEVKVCNKKNFPAIIGLIKRQLFYKESLGGRIYFHTDEYDNIWLNFDYTEIYPGGKYMTFDIVGVLEIL